jgi:hypothetical protein
MNAPIDNATPSRTGMRRVFPPWEYRHLRAWAGARIFGGIVLAGLGALMLAYGSSGWATFWLVLAALAFAGGYWELTIARSASART